MVGSKGKKEHVRLVVDGFIRERDSQGKALSRKSYINPNTGEVLTNYRYRQLARREIIKPSKNNKTTKKSTTPKKTSKKSTPSKKAPSKFQQIKSNIQKTANRQNYWRLLRRYTDKINRENKAAGLKPISIADARKSVGFRTSYYTLTHSKDNSLRGEVHYALVDFDYRDDDTDYLPGDTP